MSCEYAREHGHQRACKKMFDEINKLLIESVEATKKVNSHQTEYWREIGKQDILLALMDKISNLTNETE